MIHRTTTADYDAWKKDFDDNDKVRKQHGALSYVISRDINEAFKVTVISKWPSLDAVRGYLAVQRAAMVPVKGMVPAEIILLQDVDERSYKRSTKAEAKTA
jgi:hypothetical protein